MAEKETRPQARSEQRPQPKPEQRPAPKSEPRVERDVLTGSGAIDYALMLADTGVKAAVATTVGITTTKVVNKVTNRPKAEAQHEPKKIWTPPPRD